MQRLWREEEVHDRIDAELHTVGLQHFSQAIAHRMELFEVLAARLNNDFENDPADLPHGNGQYRWRTRA